MDHPEGAGSQRADRVDFDPRVRLEFRGTQLSSDGGLLVMRELDDAPGLSGLASSALCDSRRARMTRLCGPIHPHSSVPVTADQAWSANHLIERQNQATLQSSGKPLGECRTDTSGGKYHENWCHKRGRSRQ